MSKAKKTSKTSAPEKTKRLEVSDQNVKGGMSQQDLQDFLDRYNRERDRGFPGPGPEIPSWE